MALGLDMGSATSADVNVDPGHLFLPIGCQDDAWMNLDNNALSSLYKLLLNWLVCLYKDDSDFLFRFLIGITPPLSLSLRVG